MTSKDCGPGKCCNDNKTCVAKGVGKCLHQGCQTDQDCVRGNCCIAGNICGICPLPGVCGKGWTHFNGFCYKLVKDIKLSWGEAWHHCQDKENVSFTNYNFFTLLYVDFSLLLLGPPGLCPQPGGELFRLQTSPSQSQAAGSTLIGREQSRLGSHWSRPS